MSELLFLTDVGSTQDELRKRRAAGEPIQAIAAERQTAGRGRFGRPWSSPLGTCIALSIAYENVSPANAPWVGMAAAVHLARRYSIRLQWPNDLVYEGRKVGGLLSEVQDGELILGIGINLNRGAYPEELAHRAISLEEISGTIREPRTEANSVYKSLLEISLPTCWSELAPEWAQFDTTPGKRYIDARGREIVAEAIGADGELIGDSNGQKIWTTAADALFGPR